jgi:hypothetical protein
MPLSLKTGGRKRQEPQCPPSLFGMSRDVIEVTEQDWSASWLSPVVMAEESRRCPSGDFGTRLIRRGSRARARRRAGFLRRGHRGSWKGATVINLTSGPPPGGGHALETTVPGCQTRPSKWFDHQTKCRASSRSEDMRRMNQLEGDRHPPGPPHEHRRHHR